MKVFKPKLYRENLPLKSCRVYYEKSYEPVLTEIKISGSDNTLIFSAPRNIDKISVNAFSAVAYDQYGYPMPDCNITWQIKDLDADDGLNEYVTIDKPIETEKPTPIINSYNGSEVITLDYSYKISVIDNNGVIVSVDKDSGSVTVKLPDEKAITPDNRIIVGITDTDGKPVNGVPVTVIAKDGTEEKDLTNSEGIAIVSPTSTDITDKNGYAQVVENDNVYKIVVEDTKAKIENAAVEVKDDKITLTLPNGKTLDDNHYTITVTDNTGKTAADIYVSS